MALSKYFSFATVALIASISLAGTSAASATSTQGNLSFFVDAPAVQGSYVNGTLETFDGGCSTTWTVGTSDVPCSSTAPNTFGGASTTSATPTRGGVGTPYGTVWPGSPMTLTLSQPASYFGLWWSAGDGPNTMEFYSGSTLVGTIDLYAFVDALNSPTLHGENGVSYPTSDYYGNPVDGSNGGEPYAYLHIFAPSDSLFDRVVISETGGGGFEFDNVTVASAVQQVNTTLVHVSGPTTTKAAVTSPSLPNTGIDIGTVGFTGLALISFGFVAYLARRSSSRSNKAIN